MQVHLKKFNKFILKIGSKYDNIFCFAKILENERIAPKLIRSGNRLYEMKVEGKGLTKTVFRDS